MRSRTKANNLDASRILKACVNGVSRTMITHQPSSNSIKIISYLLLIDEGFIEVVPEGHRIVQITTQKGMSLIEKFEHHRCDTDKLICET
jgi:predicted transcriptional regulator